MKSSSNTAILIFVASAFFGYFCTDTLSGSGAPPAPCAQQAQKEPIKTIPTPNFKAKQNVRRTFTGALKDLFPIKPKPGQGAQAPPAKANPPPPPKEEPEDPAHPRVTVDDCSKASKDGLVGVTAPEGALLRIRPGIIKEVRRAWYGVNDDRMKNCLGLVDAFVEDAGLEMEVGPEVLGGNTGAKGTNKVFVEFYCDLEAGKLPDELLHFSESQKNFVKETLSAWKNADARFVTEEDKLGACAYKDEVLRLRPGEEMPTECIDSSETPAQKDLCTKKLYAGISQYAARVGTLPISYLDALRCSLVPLLLKKKGSVHGAEEGKEHTYTVKSLHDFTHSHHTTWLVKVEGQTVQWDPSGKTNSWKHELQTFSLFQMAVNVIEKAVSQDPFGFFAGHKGPLYMVVNALDNPVVGPSTADEEWSAPPKKDRAIYRSAHQGENMPSTDFIDDWTQWGSKGLFTKTKDLFPVLSWSTVPGWHRDIIAPNLHPGSCHKFFFDPKIAATPFEKKENTVLFRAFSSSCDKSAKGPRQRLVCFAEQHKELTFGDTKVRLDIGGGRGWGPSGSSKFMRPSKQANHKYLLLLDGVVAAFRSTWLLQSGSVILATGAWKDVRTQLLKPWIHYIPFSSDLHDFEDALATVVNNQTYAKWVANNAFEASLLLSGHPTEGGAPFDALYYAESARLLSESVPVTQEGDDKIKWTKDKNCKDWLETSGRIRQCLPDTYACSADEVKTQLKKVNTNFFSGSG